MYSVVKKELVERNSYKLSEEGSVLVFGDLHLSCKFEGQHKSYLYECYYNMDKIQAIVNESKPEAVFLLGDLVGVNERNIRDRQFLMRVIHFFNVLNSATNNNVYSVKGNHDMGDFTDFDFLVGLGLAKNPLYVDMGTLVRFHFVNYGDEKKRLRIDDDKTNIVLGHDDYYIEGVSEWYSAKSGIELASLGNFCGVELVISGHIHNPSTEMLSTTLKDGKTIELVYPGSPSRVAERYESCMYFELSSCEGGLGYEAKELDLVPLEEAFYDKEVFVNIDESVEEEKKKSQILTDLVNEIIEGRLTTGNVEDQINMVPQADEATKQLAISYYRKAVKGENT